MRARVKDVALHQLIGNPMEGPTPIAVWGITASNHGDMRFDATVHLEGASTPGCLGEDIENMAMLLLQILVPHVVDGSA
jgi:hypothetical protein